MTPQHEPDPADATAADDRVSLWAAVSPTVRPRRWPGCPRPSTSTGRLAPYDIAGSRAHARVLNKAGLLTADDWPVMIEGWTHSKPPWPDGSFTPAPSPTRTSTPPWSAVSWSASGPTSAASCGPGGPGTTRSPRSSGCTCATTPASSAA